MGLLTTAKAQTIRYVKTTAAGLGDGTSWANASNDLQFMINASNSGDQVWVAAGTYKPEHSPKDGVNWADEQRDNAFLLKKDVKIYGGFSGSTTETNLTARDSTLQTQQTILSGDIGTVNDSTDNTYHVVISVGAVGTPELNSLTITKGNSPGSSGSILINSKTIDRRVGGGIYNNYSAPILTNLTISGNTAYYYGGGIYNNSSSPISNECND